MSIEIKQVDKQRDASWKSKIQKRAANIVAGGLAVASIAGIGCKNIQTPNPIETPQTPLATQELINPQPTIDIDTLRNPEKRAISQRVIDKMEASANTRSIYRQGERSVYRRGEQYFLGFDDPYTNKGEDGRILLLTEPIFDENGVPTWILITYDGTLGLQVKDPNSIEAIETFIKRGIEETGKEESYSRKNRDNGLVSVHLSAIRITFTYGQDLRLLAPLIFESYRPPTKMVTKAIEQSQKRARDSAVRKLREESLVSPSNPSQTTSDPTP